MIVACVFAVWMWVCHGGKAANVGFSTAASKKNALCNASMLLFFLTLLTHKAQCLSLQFLLQTETQKPKLFILN